MKVYRFEQRREVFDWRFDMIGTEPKPELKVVRYEGVFAGEYPSYPKDANYKTYGCTLYEYKTESHRFACRTIDKLIEYFGSDFSMLLDKSDVVLVEYEVKREHCVFSQQRIEMVFMADKIINRTVIHGEEML